MTTTSLRRRISASAVGALAASLLAATPALAADPAPAPTHGVDIDYFADAYPGLGTDSVFETVTIERFEYLLKKSGTFAFFIGDPNDSSSRATIAHINQVAKARGIKRIYNFTPKLDGDTLNVWDLSRSGLTAAGQTFYATVGDRLINDHLNRDTETTFTKNATTDPYLFVYDKDHRRAGAEDRIVSALSGAKSAADLDTPAEVAAYENQVGDVLGSVDSVSPSTNFEFQKDEVNRRHSASYPNAETHGGDILAEADSQDGFRIQTLTYPELIHLLQKPGDIPILFGGTWCHNTRAIIKYVNADARNYGVRTVYNFDFSLFSSGNGGSDFGHIRDNALPAGTDPAAGVNRPSHLYGDLVNEYLTNAITQYRTADDAAALGGNVNAVTYYPGGDTTKATRQARKIQVGHVLTYNKDHVDALGNRAPVVDQAIRQNDDGGNTEHMTEWWYTAGRDLAAGDPSLRGSLNPASETGSNQLQNQRAFAKEALAEIDSVFRGLADQSVATTTTVADVGPVALGATPTVNVSVEASDHAPFISLNSANASTAPAPATGRPTGSVAVFAGDDEIGQARLKRDGTAAITLPAQTAGEHTYTVRYLGRGDLLEPSSRTVTFAVNGDPSTTTLTAPSTLTFGAGGTATATVVPASPDATTPATGTVRLSGLPAGPVEATVDGGTATLAIPATTPAGKYSLTARYTGDDTYGVSESTPVALTVDKAAARVSATTSVTRYGTAPVVRVTTTAPANVVASGTVTVTAAGKTYRGTVDSRGRAAVTLPRTLAPRTYALTVVHGGNANVRAASTTASLSVTKGSVRAVSVVPRGTVRAGRSASAVVKVSTTTGLASASGRAKVVLKRGARTRVVVATVRAGRASVRLPKLTRGTWRATVTYGGNAVYGSRTSATSVRVVG